MFVSGVGQHWPSSDVVLGEESDFQSATQFGSTLVTINVDAHLATTAAGSA